jgi:hypothetical protein
MNTTSRIARRFVTSIVAVALLATPAIAAAGSASVLTKQVLPPGGTTCAPLFVKSVTPYIYDGELQSFDVVISDSSYVGVLGAAGDVSIPFNYMTRRFQPDGSLLIHVDTTATIKGTLPVTITMLSALPNAPVCLSQVSFTTDVAGTIEASSPISVPTTPIDSGTDQGMGSDTGVVHSGGTGKTNTGSTGSNTGVTGKNTGKTSTTVGSTSSASTSSLGTMVANLCTKNGAYQLWFILLAIFFVIAAFVGLSEPALALRHGALPALLIGVPLVLLLLFWNMATDCRLSYFIPVILLVAAAIGLYSAYRTSPVIALPAEKKTTVTKTEETTTEIK